MTSIHFNALEEELKHKTSSEVRFDSITRQIYSVDASIFEIEPIGVVLPRTLDDLIQIAKIGSKYKIPLIMRGSATGITGGCLGKGLIIDTSLYLNQILKIDQDQKLAICEPGVIQDSLNLVLSPLGYRLGPDTSTGDRATIGGMAANNAAGARSMFYGSMKEAVIELELILSNGEQITLKELNEFEWGEKLKLANQEGAIYRALEEIRNEKQLIQEHFPPLPRRASGYNLLELIKPFPINPAKLVVGSEGSLGIIATITVMIVPKLKQTELHLYPFESMMEAMEAVEPLLQTNPIALEMIDDKILHAGLLAPSLRGKLEWLKEVPKALLVAEHLSGTKTDAKVILKSNEEMHHVWEVRKAGLGLLLSKRSYSRAVAFIEDVSVPPKALPQFMKAFLEYLKEKGKEAGIYGHVGPGCLHIRPYMDIHSPTDIHLIKTMMQDVGEILKSVKGALSGEHGDGIIRTWLNESFFGEEIYQLFLKIKNTFDPLGIMNPHKIVHPWQIDDHIRKALKQNPKTFLKFDGGLALSADLCNGNGACRKNQGIMCPSFQVTQNEYDSTRARANVMRKILQGEKKADLADQELHQILDLCIQCKGCKTECPSQVDMAKMKSEALYHYQEKQGYSIRNRLFAFVDQINHLSYPLRKLFNPLSKSVFSQAILKKIGIGRAPPIYAPLRFSKLAERVLQPEGQEVVLLIDTYTEFYCPEVGLAAIRVLNQCGFNAIIPPWKCCGRPAISKGVLKHAKKNAKKLTDQLNPYIKRDLPIIGLEPSCFFTLFDEYQDLIDEWSPKNCMMIEHFLSKHLPRFKLKTPQTIALHGHCHQKALEGLDTIHFLLKQIENLTVLEIPSGCCGMAGSFGYELEHMAFSKEIGELKLLPFIRMLDKNIPIIASGYSCRSQIDLHTNRTAKHLVEWLDSLICHGSSNN